MRKIFTNKQILDYAYALQEAFLKQEQEVVLPTKANFYLQKNINTMIRNAEEIEKAKIRIGQRYGEYVEEEKVYRITDIKKQQQAQKELEDLMSVDQILEIYFISFEDLQDVQLTTLQMHAMFFMLEEEE